MEKVMITCPFTGLEFEGIKYADGRIITTNKITGEDIHITYNASCNRYMIDPREFHHKPLVTLAECADRLGVSKAWVSKMATKGVLKAVRPGATVYITKESMLDYEYQKNHEERAINGNGSGEPDR